MTRRHDIDALRVFAFALLILYHTAMAYVDDWGFHLKSVHTAEWLQWPMLFVNRWRMSLLFLISGIAIALMRPESRLLRFAGLRTWRLLLPLLFGMFVIVPIQPYCEGVANGHVAPGFGHFLLRYWQVRPWPEGSFAGWQYGITWNHLWYLAYLWNYTLALALLMPLLGTAVVRRAIAFCAASPILLIGIPSALLLAWVIWLEPVYPSTNALLGDWYQHAKYATVFLAGYLLGREPVFWQRVVSCAAPRCGWRWRRSAGIWGCASSARCCRLTPRCGNGLKRSGTCRAGPASRCMSGPRCWPSSAGARSSSTARSAGYRTVPRPSIPGTCCTRA